ncbi:unnamed protein product [Gadus morhua 'NCC']
MELKDIAHFGPEVSRHTLEERVPGQPVVQQLQADEPAAGHQSQHQVSLGEVVSVQTVHAHSFVHGVNDVAPEGHLESPCVHKRQAVAQHGAQLGRQGKPRTP